MGCKVQLHSPVLGSSHWCYGSWGLVRLRKSEPVGSGEGPGVMENFELERPLVTIKTMGKWRPRVGRASSVVTQQVGVPVNTGTQVFCLLAQDAFSSFLLPLSSPKEYEPFGKHLVCAVPHCGSC